MHAVVDPTLTERIVDFWTAAVTTGRSARKRRRGPRPPQARPSLAIRAALTARLLCGVARTDL